MKLACNVDARASRRRITKRRYTTASDLIQRDRPRTC